MPYTPHPHHRSAAFVHTKSQWSVQVPEEISCYQTSVSNNWICSSNNYWGLLLHGNTPQNVGFSPLPESRPLFVAKFVGDQQGNWHGYPVATWLSPFDKPVIDILKKWQNLGYINGSQKAKLYRGKLCAL